MKKWYQFLLHVWIIGTNPSYMWRIGTNSTYVWNIGIIFSYMRKIGTDYSHMWVAGTKPSHLWSISINCLHLPTTCMICEFIIGIECELHQLWGVLSCKEYAWLLHNIWPRAYFSHTWEILVQYQIVTFFIPIFLPVPIIYSVKFTVQQCSKVTCSRWVCCIRTAKTQISPSFIWNTIHIRCENF